MSEVQTPEVKSEAKTRQMSFSVLDDGSVQATFPDSGLEPVSFKPAAIPEALYADALTEGVISVCRGALGKLSGDARTPENMRAALVAKLDAIMGGQWKTPRAAGDGVTSFSIEAEAAWIFRQKRATAKGEPIESVGTLAEASAAFAALDDAQKAKLKAVPLYQAAYAEVKAARAAANAAKLAKKAQDSDEVDF